MLTLTAIVISSLAVFAPWQAGAGVTSAGDLAQLVGPAGCVSDSGSGGACADGTALRGPLAVAVSPDGMNVYAATNTDDAVLVFDRDPATGAVQQKGGVAGCISDTGTAGQCVDGRALQGARSVVVSPDGASVYAVGYLDDSVIVFDRDLGSGALTQKAGAAGCISDSGAAGCTDGSALGGAHALVVSPDGASVYVASYGAGAVAVFDRDPGTGALTQKPGAAGCLGDQVECSEGTALGAATGIASSPDGASIYVSAGGPDAVAVFDRDLSGVLTQLPGAAGCISSEGSGGGCASGVALGDAWAVTVSPDGANVYVAAPSAGGLSVFDRDPATGALTQQAGAAGCITGSGSDGACTPGIALDGGRSLTVSPDGAALLLAAEDSSAVAVFDRHPSTGTLVQKAGTAACASESGLSGACADVTGVGGAWGVALSPDGEHAYVAGNASNAVAVFDVFAPGTPFRRPDLTVRRAGGTWLGDGVLDEDGLGQTARVSRERPGFATFFARVHNDALVSDRFVVAEVASSDWRVRFRYFKGRTLTDITDQVVTGTYQTRVLQPGESATVRIEVSVRKRARHEFDYRVALRGTSSVPEARTDTVAAVVHIH